MRELRLPKLPDRTPVKIAISVAPDLNQALLDYAALYGDVYGQTESVPDLIPAMLATFLDGDRAFARRRRGQGS
jgi:hypothetical protein